MSERQRWVGEAGPILGIAVLVAAKFWALITPWARSRQFLGEDFGLSVEPYFYHMLKRGAIPLWDPTLGTGSSFLGGGAHQPMLLQGHFHLFYPLNLLWLGLAERHQFIPHSVLQYHHVFHYFLAGVFAYVYGRVLALPRFSATVSAIAFMFSGFLLAHVQHWTIIDTIVWLPLVLACLVRADATERPRWGALGGLFLGVAFLAGHAQIFYYVGLATSALGLTLLGRRWAVGRPWRRAAAVLGLVPLVALGVSAVQLLPSWQVALASERAGLDYGWKAIGSLPPSYLFQLLLPWGLLSIAGWRGYVSEFSLYAGVLPLIFAGYALTRRWDWRIGFHATLGLGALLLAFGDTFGLYPLAFQLLPGLQLFRIPARILGLVSFTMAVLAGLGTEAFLAAARVRGLLRFLTCAVVLAGAGAIPVLLLLVLNGSGPTADPVRGLADQYVLLLILLGLSLLVVRWRARGGSPRLVHCGIMTLLVLDLVFGSFAITGASPNPDPISPTEQRLVDVLAEDPAPFRLSGANQIHPRLIYRYGWSVFDDESTLAPQSFLDLYVLREVNPRILDLLNVKYLLADAWLPPPSATVFPLSLWPGAVRRVALSPDGPVREITLDSRLVYGPQAPQDTRVAVLHVLGTDGSSPGFPIRAGVETAEWASDAPGAKPAHARPPVARSWAVTKDGYEGHSYRATFALPPAFRPRQLVLERTSPDAVLVVERVRLDGRDLPPPPERLHSVMPGLLENREALPRAFLVRRARQVPASQETAQLRELDPREEALLTDPLPRDWDPAPVLSGPPLPPVTIAEYSPERIRLETETAEPLILVLSDTYDPRWHAWDNGRPVTIRRVDHALRGLFLERAGRHAVEFRYRARSFWLGLGISAAMLAALGTGAVGGRLTRRSRRPSAR